MTLRVLQVNKDLNRSLVLDSENNYAIAYATLKEGQEVNLTNVKLFPMPSFLFAMACLYEQDLDKAILQLESYRETKWSY